MSLSDRDRNLATLMARLDVTSRTLKDYESIVERNFKDTFRPMVQEKLKEVIDGIEEIMYFYGLACERLHADVEEMAKSASGLK